MIRELFLFYIEAKESGALWVPWFFGGARRLAALWPAVPCARRACLAAFRAGTRRQARHTQAAEDKTRRPVRPGRRAAVFTTRK